MDYILLDICEKNKLHPINDFDPLPDVIKKQMIAKWHLDREFQAEQQRYTM